MKYIYGPVKSRRLGLSLGITLTPYKICSFDCIYCQLGKTTEKVSQRKEYINVEEVLVEIKFWLQNNPQERDGLGYITFSGSGEPTLNKDLGRLIQEIKKLVNVPIAVITNASLFSDPLLRQELLAVDLVIPSLDAVEPKAFQEIDRPHPDVKLEGIIEGLVAFSKEFKGKIWLEVMLVKGVNDTPEQIRRLREVIERINPDKIQLNSPVRSTAEENVLPVEKGKLEKLREMLGDKCEIV